MTEPVKNLVYPETCVHIEKGELQEVERIEMELRFTTVNPQDDYRWGKGPDTLRLCPFCAGKLLGMMHREKMLR